MSNGSGIAALVRTDGSEQVWVNDFLDLCVEVRNGELWAHSAADNSERRIPTPMAVGVRYPEIPWLRGVSNVKVWEFK